jgi:hypothetical protein
MSRRIGLTWSYPPVGWAVCGTVSQRVLIITFLDAEVLPKRRHDGPAVPPFGPLFCRHGRLLEREADVNLWTSTMVRGGVMGRASTGQDVSTANFVAGSRDSTQLTGAGGLRTMRRP